MQHEAVNQNRPSDNLDSIIAFLAPDSTDTEKLIGYALLLRLFPQRSQDREFISKAWNAVDGAYVERLLTSGGKIKYSVHSFIY